MSNKIQTVNDAVSSVLYSRLKRGDFIFRGQINSEWEALPSLLRSGDTNASKHEALSLNPIFYKEKVPFVYDNDPMELLCYLQHNGEKTRLLDLTRDVLIALFFACYDKEDRFIDKDGKLYILERQQFPEFDINCSDSFHNNVDDVFVQSVRQRIDTQYPSIFEPIIKNPRMRAQEGLFILFTYHYDNLNSKYYSIEGYHRLWNKNRTENEKFWSAHKIIDKLYKKSILDELSNIHKIDENTLLLS